MYNLWAAKDAKHHICSFEPMNDFKPLLKQITKSSNESAKVFPSNWSSKTLWNIPSGVHQLMADDHSCTTFPNLLACLICYINSQMKIWPRKLRILQGITKIQNSHKVNDFKEIQNWNKSNNHTISFMNGS